jgi:hypothetical protein
VEKYLSDRVDEFLDKYWFNHSPAIRALILVAVGVLVGAVVF